MPSLNQKYSLIVFTFILASLGCSKDTDEFNKDQLKGNWKLEGIYNIDCDGNEISSNQYDLVWKIMEDSIEYTRTQYLGEGFGDGVMKSRIGYTFYTDGTFIHSQNNFQIETLSEDDCMRPTNRIF
ncbi:hypothetical protein [Salegentibacter sp. Hel_I_6]|uniref:hypothetical protein n=1 Tax=Salegentibacter sp. Hel_I_6 TaxID=1250278 RepID=UPI00056C690F|nr:hypothetical protein [Salegentibacter sp. Hel_I_6]